MGNRHSRQYSHELGFHGVVPESRVNMVSMTYCSTSSPQATYPLEYPRVKIMLLDLIH